MLSYTTNRKLITLGIMAILLLIADWAVAKDITVRWQPPVTRENGDTLAIDELGPFTLRIHVGGAIVHEIEIEATKTSLLVANLETWTNGAMGMTMVATDKGGLVSQPSGRVDINIAAPSAPDAVDLEW